MKPNVKRYLIAAIVAFALTFLFLVLNDIFVQDKKSEIYRILSDSCFAVGVIFVGIGVIIFSGDHGLFDMLIFGVGMLFTALKRDVTQRKYKDFYEYRQAKKDREKHSTGYILVVGIALIALSVIFLVCYNKAISN